MRQRIWKATLAFAIATSLVAGPLTRPAQASTGSTYTLIEAGLALIGGIILYNNYEHKRQAANTIVGYTRNGGTVYGDGRIVMPDGTVIYPGRNGVYPWGQPAYYEPNAAGYAYDYNRTGMYDRTHRHTRYVTRTRYRYDNDDRDRDDAVQTRYYTQPRYVRTYRVMNRGRGHARARGHAKHDHGGDD